MLEGGVSMHVSLSTWSLGGQNSGVATARIAGRVVPSDKNMRGLTHRSHVSEGKKGGPPSQWQVAQELYAAVPPELQKLILSEYDPQPRKRIDDVRFKRCFDVTLFFFRSSRPEAWGRLVLLGSAGGTHCM